MAPLVEPRVEVHQPLAVGGAVEQILEPGFFRRTQPAKAAQAPAEGDEAYRPVQHFAEPHQHLHVRQPLRIVRRDEPLAAEPFVDVRDDVHGLGVEHAVVHQRRHHQVRLDQRIGRGEVLLAHQG
ncbi:MAG: hypothetical protein ACN6I7_00395 [bacterium]